MDWRYESTHTKVLFLYKFYNEHETMTVETFFRSRVDEVPNKQHKALGSKVYDKFDLDPSSTDGVGRPGAD